MEANVAFDKMGGVLRGKVGGVCSDVDRVLGGSREALEDGRRSAGPPLWTQSLPSHTANTAAPELFIHQHAVFG